MMEKKYQLVAWTQNIADMENARLYMTPSLKSEIEAPYIDSLCFIHKESYKCPDTLSLAISRKAIKACERMSEFKILTGHIGTGIRYLFFAASYCPQHRQLRHEFVRLCEKAKRLARLYNREDILSESYPQKYLSILLDKPQAT